MSKGLECGLNVTRESIRCVIEGVFMVGFLVVVGIIWLIEAIWRERLDDNIR